ncbi:MAG TPA: hypothetical protein VII92_01880, partial [Anaerolineae bacterium]
MMAIQCFLLKRLMFAGAGAAKQNEREVILSPMKLIHHHQIVNRSSSSLRQWVTGQLAVACGQWVDQLHA